MIRTVKGTVPSYSLSDFAAVLAVVRNLSANAAYVVQDSIFDAAGMLTSQFDARGTETRFEYDSRGRQTNQRQAYATTVEARTETLYDAQGNVTEVHSPRYFDSGDTNGYQKAKETWTYTGRNQPKTHTEAVGTTEAATEYFTYDLKGRQATHTDFAGKLWATIFDSCCDKAVASKNPLLHGSIRNANSRKQFVHSATVSDVADHVALERSRGNWWNGLPKCPCKLNPRMKFCLGSAWSDGFENPDDSLWGDPYVPTTAEESLHPGIAYSMRSKGGPPTNQCTYDATGNLHLNPPMAGTVDSELPGTLPHLSQDVDPIGLANSLDGGCPVNIWTMPWGKCKVLNPPGPNMMKYYRVRPLWAEPCGRPNFNMQIPWVKLSKRIGGLVQANIH